MEPDLASEFRLFLDDLAEKNGEIRRQAEALASGTGFAHGVADWHGFIKRVAERFTDSVKVGAKTTNVSWRRGVPRGTEPQGARDPG